MNNNNNNSIPFPQNKDIIWGKVSYIVVGLIIAALIVVSFFRYSVSNVMISRPDLTFCELPEGIAGHELLVEKTICHVFWYTDAVNRLYYREIRGFSSSFVILVQMTNNGLDIRRQSSCGSPAIDGLIDTHIGNWRANHTSFSLMQSGWQRAYERFTFRVRIFPGGGWNVEVLEIQRKDNTNPYTALQFCGPSSFSRYWSHCLPIVFGNPPSSLSFNPDADREYQRINSLFLVWRGTIQSPSKL